MSSTSSSGSLSHSPDESHVGRSPGADASHLVAAYIDHLAVERNASPNTLSNYQRDLNKYVAWLDQHNLSIDSVEEPDIEQFIADLRRGDSTLEWSPLAASSAARATVAVRSLHRFSHEEGQLARDVTVGVTVPRAGQSLPHALTVEQVNRLIEACPVNESSGPIALRDRALIELLYGTGMRISEALNLDIDSIDRNHSFVRVVGKGRKERLVPIGAPALHAIEAWLVRGRPSMVKRSDRAMFLNARGNRLGRQSVWKFLHAAAERCGLGDSVGPHTLRHSYATHLLQGGADIRAVQELLGHASVTTTQIYTAVSIDNLREVYATSHPRA